MAVQLAPHNIRVNSISPNMIGSPVGKDKLDTNRKIVNLKGRPGEPVDVARVAVFLVSENAEFLVGVDILVDGGKMAIL